MYDDYDYDIGYGCYDGDDYDFEPDLDEVYEFESAMASAGWGTDEDYGYYGDDEGW